MQTVCLPNGPERCFNALDDNCNGVADEGCGLPTGLAQFLIAWDAPDADLDLHVVDPHGHLAEAGQVSPGGLIKERDCPGPKNECQGRNLENVYLQQGRSVAKGRFGVRVRLEKLSDRDQPVRVTLAVRLGQRSHTAQFIMTREGSEREFQFTH